MRWLIVLALALGLAACGEDDQTAEAPPPVTPTRDAVTYFGRMILVDHQGPKAQIHLKSQQEPLWFPAVRDAKAFTLLPGEAKDVTAIYVTDMAAADGWDHPRTWAPAEGLIYVIRSSRVGGMGQPEAVPFSDRAAAEAFAEDYGGDLVSWEEIPEDYVIGESPMEMDHSAVSPIEFGPHDICTTPPQTRLASTQPEETR